MQPWRFFVDAMAALGREAGRLMAAVNRAIATPLFVRLPGRARRTWRSVNLRMPLHKNPGVYVLILLALGPLLLFWTVDSWAYAEELAAVAGHATNKVVWPLFSALIILLVCNSLRIVYHELPKARFSIRLMCWLAAACAAIFTALERYDVSHVTKPIDVERRLLEGAPLRVSDYIQFAPDQGLRAAKNLKQITQLIQKEAPSLSGTIKIVSDIVQHDVKKDGALASRDITEFELRQFIATFSGALGGWVATSDIAKWAASSGSPIAINAGEFARLLDSFAYALSADGDKDVDAAPQSVAPRGSNNVLPGIVKLLKSEDADKNHAALRKVMVNALRPLMQGSMSEATKDGARRLGRALQQRGYGGAGWLPSKIAVGDLDRIASLAFATGGIFYTGLIRAAWRAVDTMETFAIALTLGLAIIAGFFASFRPSHHMRPAQHLLLVGLSLFMLWGILLTWNDSEIELVTHHKWGYSPIALVAVFSLCYGALLVASITELAVMEKIGKVVAAAALPVAMALAQVGMWNPVSSQYVLGSSASTASVGVSVLFAGFGSIAVACALWRSRSESSSRKQPKAT